MAYTYHIGKLDWRYIIILLLCLSLLVGPHFSWKTKGIVITRKTVSVVSSLTIQVTKEWQLPNLTQTGIYGYNDMDTCADTCCADTNRKLVSSFNDVFKVSPLLELYMTVKEISVECVITFWMDPTTSR